MKRVVVLALLIVGLMGGSADRTAMAANPSYDGSPATATVNVRITIPASVNICNLQGFSLDMPSMTPGIAYGSGQFSIDTNCAAGVSVTGGYSRFSPTPTDAMTTHAIMDDASLEPVITVTLAFGSPGVAATGSSKLTVDFAVLDDTELALTGDNHVNIALLNVSTAEGSLSDEQKGISTCLVNWDSSVPINDGYIISKITPGRGVDYASGVICKAPFAEPADFNSRTQTTSE